ncbi:MAG: hypothetical protein ACM30I_08210 [Gemmatimonas sp.]
MRSNVVSTLVPKPASAPRAVPCVGDSSNVIAFPGARDRTSTEPKLRGSTAWAQDVVAVDRRLAFAAVDARKRLNRLVRESLPRPMFVPEGAGYERMSAIAARDLLADPCVAFGPEERKLLAAVDRYEAAQIEWERARQALAGRCGLDAILSARNELRDDATEAYNVLRCNGIDPLHP